MKKMDRSEILALFARNEANEEAKLDLHIQGVKSNPKVPSPIQTDFRNFKLSFIVFEDAQETPF